MGKICWKEGKNKEAIIFLEKAVKRQIEGDETLKANTFFFLGMC